MAGYLFVDLANAAARRLDEVVLVTGSVHPMNTPLDPRVKVLPIRRYQRHSLRSRLASWLGGLLDIARLVRRQLPDHRLLISSNPPIATWLPLAVDNTSYLYVLDVYPDALHLTGLTSQRSPIYRSWAALNRRAYGRYTKIFTMTSGMKALLEAGGARGVEVVPSWGDDFSSLAMTGSNARDAGQPFRVVYSGNLGREYPIEAILELARATRHRRDVRFTIAGKGWKYEAIERAIREDDLPNVELMPFQDPEGYSQLMRSAAIAVVVQASTAPDVCIPSKIYNTIAFGTPVLCIGDPATDLGRLVREEKLGQVLRADQIDEMRAFVEELADRRLEPSGFDDAFARARTKYSKQNAADLIERIAAS